MKIRKDFVTNSSSSSFIIENHSDEGMTAEDIVQSLLAKVLEDARKRTDVCVPPHGHITLTCGDHMNEDGAFEVFIHNEAGSTWSTWLESYGDGKVSVEFNESYH